MRSALFTILTFLFISNAIAGNTWQTAIELPQDSRIEATQDDGETWFVITITGNQPNKRILIDLTFTHAVGNIDIDLFNDNTADPFGIDPGTLRDRSAGTTSDHEFIENPIPSVPGTYYIRVYGADAGNSYQLIWTELTGSDDGFEPNDSSADAEAIVEVDVAFGSQSNEDWYSIDVE